MNAGTSESTAMKFVVTLSVSVVLFVSSIGC